MYKSIIGIQLKSEQNVITSISSSGKNIVAALISFSKDDEELGALLVFSSFILKFNSLFRKISVFTSSSELIS